MHRLALIREGKTPPDSRVALTPEQCSFILKKYPNLSIKVQHSPNRCYADKEYEAEGLTLTDDISDADILFGIKEVPLDMLIPDKTYLFFSHTIKKQEYNKGLLQKVLKSNIRLIDYECLREEKGQRVIAFGRFAGIVGAHNGLMTLGKRLGTYQIPRATEFKDFAAIKEFYKKLSLPPMKIVVTGGGRVAKGSMEVLDALGIRKVDPYEYLVGTYNEPIYTQLNTEHLYAHRSKRPIVLQEFYDHPHEYTCRFLPFTRVTDLMINAIYWDPEAPVYFTKNDMKSPDFKIKTIADITCDIEGSVPSTLRASTIADPVYGYDPQTESECEPYKDGVVDVMAVDNLPNELPRDASDSFGQQLISQVLDNLLGFEQSNMIPDATIAQDGHLTEGYEYLGDWVG